MFNKRRNVDTFKIKATRYEATLIINLMIEIIDNLRKKIIESSSKEKRKDYISMRNTAMKLCKQFGISLYDEDLNKLKSVEKELIEFEELYPVVKEDDILKLGTDHCINDEKPSEEEKKSVECL